MAATTTLLGLVTPTQGTLTGTWGDTVNYGITDYVDIAIAGTLSFAGDGAITLANTTGSSSGNSIGATTAQYAIIRVTGTLTTAKIITGPSYSKTYLVVNAATGSTVTFKASGQTGVSIAVGETALVYYNGTDYVKVVGTATAGAAGGSTTQVQYNNSGVLAGITGATSNGTALTLVAPVLGTPASGTVTNLTGTASININGTVGATTPTTGAFTTLSATKSSTGDVATFVGSGGYTAYINSSGTGVSFGDIASLGANWSGIRTIYQTSVNTYAAGFLVTSTSSTGLAVTGTLSATGTLSGGTSGTAYSFSGSAPATSLTLTSGGDVGIGTSSPAHKLDVSAASGAIARFKGTGSYGYVYADNTSSTGGGAFVALQNGVASSYFGVEGAILGTTSTDTGIYNNIAGSSIKFYNNGSATLKMTLDPSGNLGIGTSSPAYKLEVATGTTGQQSLASFRTADTTTANNAGIQIFATPSSTATSRSTYIMWDADGANASGADYFYIQKLGNSGQVDLIQQSAAAMTFQTSGAERMRLDSSGNLGLGVTPQVWSSIYDAFQIGAQGAFWANATANDVLLSANLFLDVGHATKYITNGYASYYSQNVGSHTWAIAPNNTSGAGAAATFTSAMTLDAGGRLMLGTTSSPSQQAVIYRTDSSTSNGALLLDGNGNYAGIQFAQSGNVRGSLCTDASALYMTHESNIYFRTGSSTNVGGTTRVTIDSSGNLLVGGTSVVLSSKFLSQFDGSTHNGAVLNETANTASTTYLAFSLSGTAIGAVARVGATSAVIYNTTSDQRLKSNIQTAAPVLEKLMQVQVRQYDWTVGDLHQEYGFIAQELEPVLSGVVTKGKTEEDMWQLDYSRLTPHLVKAIQELKAEFDAYKASHP